MLTNLVPLILLPLINVLTLFNTIPLHVLATVYGLCSILLLNFYIRLKEPVFLYITSILLSLQLLSFYLIDRWLGFGIIPDMILLYAVLLLTVLTKDSHWGYVYGVETPVIMALTVVLGIGLGLTSPTRYVMFSLLESLGVVNDVLEGRTSILYYVFLFLILYTTPYILHQTMYACPSALLFASKLLVWRISKGKVRYVISADVIAKVGLAVVLGGL